MRSLNSNLYFKILVSQEPNKCSLTLLYIYVENFIHVFEIKLLRTFASKQENGMSIPRYRHELFRHYRYHPSRIKYNNFVRLQNTPTDGSCHQAGRVKTTEGMCESKIEGRRTVGRFETRDGKRNLIRMQKML